MKSIPNTSPDRLNVVDALRGFAIISIMLLHNIEHFDFYYIPEQLPAWLSTLDKIIWDSLFFLFGGKSYAIFALLFGVTFFIQYNNRLKRGEDFCGRFLWRLLLLLGFGIINSIFFEGDILGIYAVIGVIMVPFRKLSNTIVLTAAILFMLQPLEWFYLIKIVLNPDYTGPVAQAGIYFQKIDQYLSNGSFFEAAWGNLTNGRTAVLYWSLENGRYFQTAALFLSGMLLGRQNRFAMTSSNHKFWDRALLLAVIAFIPLFYLKSAVSGWPLAEALRLRLGVIITSWSNFAFMSVLVALFVILFRFKRPAAWLTKLSPVGRMSLSNYIIQSILGSFIYYGYGLGLYQYTSATHCLLIGMVLAVVQTLFSKWWMNGHKRGPLEGWWHKATWMGIKK